MEPANSSSTFLKLVLPISIASITFVILGIIRRIWFHPLSHIPGPLLAKVSQVHYSRNFLSGRQPWRQLELHEKYGKAVRIAPNEISFSTAQAWHDIYAPRKGGEFLKSAVYDQGAFGKLHSIVSERDPVEHAQMRKLFSRAFSETALRDQEDMINDFITKYIEGIGKTSKKDGAVNLTCWHNFLTFDIVGYLAFGQHFGGLETGKYHFWLSDVLGSITQAPIADTLVRFPWLGILYIICNAGWAKRLMAVTKRHTDYSIKVTKDRINEKTDRKDFMYYLLRDRVQADGTEISDMQLTSHASDLVIAGSETTATTLSVAVHYLLENPAVLKKLTDEILGKFEKEEDINSTSTAPLKYLHAVCQESLRVYPPLPAGISRVAPEGAVVDGIRIPKGSLVSVNPFAASMSPSNFQNPTEFIPERWLGDNKNDILDASQPFSIGRRGCIGRTMAWLELKLTLSRLIFRYEMEREGELDWTKESVMNLFWEKPTLMVKLKDRVRN